MGSAALGASLARLGFAANAARTVTTTANAAKAGRAVRAATAVGKTVAQAFPSAFVFTTSDTVLRQVGLGSDGDRKLSADVGRSFADFAENLAKNTAMFAAFAGMEKFAGGVYSKLVSNKIPENLKILQVPVKETGSLVTLTAGDIAVMQALHAAETGKMEWDWGAAFSALVFRAGATSVEKILPKLMDKFRNKNPEKQAKNVDNIADEIARIQNL